MLMQRFAPSPDPVGTLDFGVGVNWFDFLGSGGMYARWDQYPLSAPAYPPIDDRASWDALLGELTRLRPGFIRFGLPPDPILNPDGTLRKDSVHFRHLDLAAQWCENHGAVMILDTFITPERYEFPVNTTNANICLNMAARDNRAYAREFVAPLMHHVVVERGLRSIRFFNPINEPIHYGVYQTPPEGPDVFRHYVDLYREMRSALDDAGLATIGLIGIDKDLPFDFPVFEYLARGIDVNPHVAAYSIHSYRGRFDWDGQNPLVPDSDPLSTLVDKWTKRLVSYAHNRGKYLLALEVGVFQYGARAGNPEGPSTAEATLLTAETILRMINVGVRGGLVWSFTNPNTIDGSWRLVHVEGERVERAPHPYSTYGMLMRAARPGSTVFPLSPTEREFPAQYVWGTLFVQPRGGVNLVLINDHPGESRTVTVQLPSNLSGAVMNKLLKDRHRHGIVDGPGISLAPGKAQLEDVLPPLSLQVYTTDAVENLL
jgi:hypothetical protein